MGIGLVRTPVVIVQCVHRQDGLDRRHIDDAVVGGVLVERAVNAAFGAGTIVVVNLATNLVVGVCGVGGEDLRFTGIHLLFRKVKRVPFGQFGAPIICLSVRPDRKS